MGDREGGAWVEELVEDGAMTDEGDVDFILESGGKEGGWGGGKEGRW